MFEFSLQCVILSMKLTILPIVCFRCVGAFSLGNLLEVLKIVIAIVKKTHVEGAVTYTHYCRKILIIIVPVHGYPIR